MGRLPFAAVGAERGREGRRGGFVVVAAFEAEVDGEVAGARVDVGVEALGVAVVEVGGDVRGRDGERSREARGLWRVVGARQLAVRPTKV